MKKTTAIRGLLAASMLLVIAIAGCKKELPGAGSIPDNTPPTADFSWSQLSSSDFLEVTFSNTSTSATDFFWDFGDGTSSIALEPVHNFPAEGKYTVTLTATDKLGVSDTKEIEIELEEPAAYIPPILENSFEDGQLTGGTGDGRDSWRNSDLGGVIQITSSPVNTGSQAAKLTGDPGDKRIGYQLLTVTENTVYDVSFFYTMKSSPAGFITVAILDGPATSHADALSKMIGAITVNDQNDPNAYVQETVSFYSGSNTEVAIYFFNDGTVESRLDDFSIDVGAGPIPPLAAFTYAADTSDYRTITFTNGSSNADSYIWDFGDGNTSTDVSPTYTYTADSNYTVTLTANNVGGGTAMTSMTVPVNAPATIAINNGTFDDEPVRDDNRIAWRNVALETDADNVFGSSDYMLQTSTTARNGSYAGKLPTAENSSKPRRWLYQAIQVNPNTNYEISGWIRNKNANVGSTVTFEIYDAPFSDATVIGTAGNIIQSEDFDSATGHDTNAWTEAKINFNSGSSTEVVLFITNDYTLTTTDSESFFDDFVITEK